MAIRQLSASPMRIVASIAALLATGRVSGKIRYGKVVIEEGGQLVGEVQVGTHTKSAAKPSTQAPSQPVPQAA